MRVLVSGHRGFIGYHLCNRLLECGHEVVGVDEMNSYYDIKFKERRTINSDNFCEHICSIEELDKDFFERYKFDAVVNLAGQAGVRYSIENPMEYVRCNLLGFCNLLDLSRRYEVDHFLYASSSSVYGDIKTMPFREEYEINSLKSFYATTKYCNELIARNYSSVYGIRTSGMRFFTVYGEEGRPDMMYYKMAEAMRTDEPITIHTGELYRDFTYIRDIVEGIMCLLCSDDEGAEIYNIGCGETVSLCDFIRMFEEIWGKELKKEYISPTRVDVSATFADISKMKNKVGWMPKVSIKEGLENFIKWYKECYNVK